jgi:hypothetical protein
VKLRRKVIVLTIVLISVIFISLFVGIDQLNDKPQSIPEFFIGVESAYGNTHEIKELVSKARNYTNLFVLGLPEISLNQSLLNETCDYIYNAGLSFVVLFTGPSKYDYEPHVWISRARQKYGDKFIGAYREDEPGGKQLDNSEFRFVLDAKNYSDAAESYVKAINDHLVQENWLSSGATMFTADYGLYWFNYQGGYDVVLTEFGWNHSRPLHVALNRGAARMHDKDWGTIVTWTYNGTPYLESGAELYDDLILAYHAGAKYMVIFDYPETVYSEYGILTDEHFNALEDFWNYVNNNPNEFGTIKAEVAYVLPENYGYGFRGANDKIWGLWSANTDDRSEKIWSDVNQLLDEYMFSLDIVYNDSEFNADLKRNYDKLVFWNETAK